MRDLGDNPNVDDWDLCLTLLSDQLEYFGPEDEEDPARRIVLKRQDRTEAVKLLEDHGHLAARATVQRMFWTKRDWALEMRRRANGDWSPIPRSTGFPRWPPAAPQNGA